MGKVFRASLLGFNRNQVIAYIDAILERHNAVLGAEKDKFNQLSEENTELKERLAALEQAQATTAEQHEALEAETQTLRQELEAATTQLADKTAEYEAKLKAAGNALREMPTLRSECEQLKQHIATLEKRRPVVVAKPVEREKPHVAETAEISQKTEELWTNLKCKIQGLSQEFSKLTADMQATEQASGHEKTTKVYSIKEILERIKKIGETL